jgi:hypothetical protein
MSVALTLSPADQLPRYLRRVLDIARACADADGTIGLAVVAEQAGATRDCVIGYRYLIRQVDPSLWPWSTRKANADRPAQELPPEEVAERREQERARRPEACLRTDPRDDGPGAVYWPASRHTPNRGPFRRPGAPLTGEELREQCRAYLREWRALRRSWTIYGEAERERDLERLAAERQEAANRPSCRGRHPAWRVKAKAG